MGFGSLGSPGPHGQEASVRKTERECTAAVDTYAAGVSPCTGLAQWEEPKRCRLCAGPSTLQREGSTVAAGRKYRSTFSGDLSAVGMMRYATCLKLLLGVLGGAYA